MILLRFWQLRCMILLRFWQDALNLLQHNQLSRHGTNLSIITISNFWFM
jgi:hypothetical protein